MLIYSNTKIIALRNARGWNQSELARAAKLSSPTVWALEKGETKMPKYATLSAVAQALGVPLQAIMPDDVPADINDQIAAAAAALSPTNKGALLAAAIALRDSQK